MDGKYITGICTVFVAVLMVGGLLMPIIDHTTEGEPVINPDAGWIRMNYDTAASAYTINISASDDGITVANGTDTQTGDDETIYYADSNLAVWLEDGYFTVLGQSTNGPVFFQSEDDITITRDSEGVTVTDGVNTVSVGAPTWAYVPYSSGSYGFFADGVAASTNNKPTVAVGGGFAGVYAYNDITRYAGLGLELQTVTDGGQITGAYWAKPSAEEPVEDFNPGSITPINPGAINGGDADIQPIDPIDIDPLNPGDNIIMSVPTPTYTEGDWGYDTIAIGGVTKAKIVSYSGAGGDIVVPATIGGYDVYRFGKTAPSESSDSYNVIDNSTISANSTITFPNGLVQIGRYALYGADKLTGTLTIPDTVTEIGGLAFNGCSGFTGLVLSDNLTTIYGSAFYGCSGFTGSLVIPDSVTTLKDQSFRLCSGFTGSLVIPDSVTSIGATSFYGSDGFKELIISSDATPDNAYAFTMTSVDTVLDLSDTVDYSVNRYGIPAGATVQDNIGDSIGYLGVAFIPGESDLSPSAVALMYVIPVIILVSLIIFGAVVFVRRDY